MTIQAATHKLHPKFCGKSKCVEGGTAAMLYISLYLLALGLGGVRGSLPALGADQFDQKNPKEAKAIASFFNWLLLSTTIGGALGVTAVVYVSTNVGWYYGFMISTIATFLGFVVLALGKPFYRTRVPGNSPILRIIQVFQRLYLFITITHIETQYYLFRNSTCYVIVLKGYCCGI